MKIPFNKPHLTGKETHYIYNAVSSGKISGNGNYTQLCQDYLETKYGFKKCLLTTSCTDALEMAAILFDIQPGDEVIVPSFTFVSSANAFVLRGAKLIFADSLASNPNIDASKIEDLITPKTKAIVVVHYAGVACDMDTIMRIANDNKLFVVEDAAQAIDSYYKGQPLGSIGHLGTFSFHETKNIISGEGGLLTINDEQFIERSEIIWEKGTNRSAFFRGEVDKYSWVDIGSSFLPSEVVSAFLFAQIECISEIQQRRIEIWETYQNAFKDLNGKSFKTPEIPSFATNNAHMYYLVCKDNSVRNGLIDHLKQDGIWAVFHYLSLHSTPFYQDKHDGRDLPFSDLYTERLVRLPLYFDLTQEEQQQVIDSVKEYVNQI